MGGPGVTLKTIKLYHFVAALCHILHLVLPLITSKHARMAHHIYFNTGLIWDGVKNSRAEGGPKMHNYV
jgi:hypothetical protein